MDVVHDRRGERQQLARQALHLLGHLDVRHAVVDQRLVHVEVEEAHLGVGDPRERLAVDAHELEEGDEREAGLQRGADVAQQLQVVLGDLLARRCREADRAPDALEQRRLEPRQLGRVLERVGRRAVREEVLEQAVGEPARFGRRADLVHRVAALAQPRDDPRVRDRGRGPLAVGERHEAVAGPAAQRVGRDVELARELGEDHPRQDKAAGPRSWSRRHAGNAARCLGRRRSSEATPCEGHPPHFPAYCLGW